MKKGVVATLGFLLILYGFIALVLMMIGMQLSFLVWIDGWGKLLGFVIRLLMIVVGVVMMYLDLSDWKNIEAEG